MMMNGAYMSIRVTRQSALLLSSRCIQSLQCSCAETCLGRAGQSNASQVPHADLLLSVSEGAIVPFGAETLQSGSGLCKHPESRRLLRKLTVPHVQYGSTVIADEETMGNRFHP